MGPESQAWFDVDNQVKLTEKESHTLISPKELQDILAKIKEEEKKSLKQKNNPQPQTSRKEFQNILVKNREEENKYIFSNEDPAEYLDIFKDGRLVVAGKVKVKKKKSNHKTLDTESISPNVWDYYELDPNDQSKSTCLYCREIFDYVYQGSEKSIKGLLMHLKIMHGLFINDTVARKKDRERKIGRKKAQFMCKECGKIYREKRTQLACEGRHRQEFGMMCSECGKGFNYKHQHAVHLLTHTEDKPFKCPSCGKRFRTKTNLQQHLRVHSGETPLECHKCHKKFRFYGQKNNHECIQHLS